jgi:hypothetical protein
MKWLYKEWYISLFKTHIICPLDSTSDVSSTIFTDVGSQTLCKIWLLCSIYTNDKRCHNGFHWIQNKTDPILSSGQTQYNLLILRVSTTENEKNIFNISEEYTRIPIRVKKNLIILYICKSRNFLPDSAVDTRLSEVDGKLFFFSDKRKSQIMRKIK